MESLVCAVGSRIIVGQWIGHADRPWIASHNGRHIRRKCYSSQHSAETQRFEEFSGYCNCCCRVEIEQILKIKHFMFPARPFFLVSCRNLTSRMSVWPDFFGWSRFTFPLIFFSLKKFSVLTLSPQSQRTCVCVFLSRGPLPKVYSLRCLRFFFLKFFENLAIHTSIQSNTN